MTPLLLDVAPAVEALQKQPGVPSQIWKQGGPSQICAVGFGVGANLVLMYAAHAPEIGALALIMPGYGCEEFDPLDALSPNGTRPLLLIESKKRVESDLAHAFKLITRVRTQNAMEQVVLPREPGPLLTDLGSGQEGALPLLEWLGRMVPVNAR